jgi:hypothetical protein
MLEIDYSSFPPPGTTNARILPEPSDNTPISLLSKNAKQGNAPTSDLEFSEFKLIQENLAPQRQMPELNSAAVLCLRMRFKGHVETNG